MKLVSTPSPNFEPRPDGARIDLLVLHYTGMPTADSALARLTDPAAKVSAHYLIEEDGTTHALVPESRRAWHAGQSSWGGDSDVNSRSIGIELVNPGHEFGYRPFPEAQLAALEILAPAVLERHAIPAHGVLAHSDVAPSRKKDPGELFPWRRLAAAGIGLYPPPRVSAPPFDERRGLSRVLAGQIGLLYIGYDIALTGEEDEAGRLVVEAFQRHFLPEGLTGRIDLATSARIETMVRLIALDRGDVFDDL